MIMDPKEFVKQVIDFQKAQVENSFSFVRLVQEQNEKMSKALLEQLTWLPESEKTRMNEWSQACKKMQDDYMKSVDDQFRTVQKVLLGGSGA